MAERNIVPNLETKATDGNPVFTPRQWLERLRQFCKREHKIDINPLLKGENITDANWNGKEQAIQEDFIWGVGPEALYQITTAEYKTELDSIKVKDLIRLFTEFYMPKRNTYHNRGDFFWAKQTEDETPEEFWRRLIEIEKECNFNAISAEELLISKYMTAVTDKKVRDKTMKEKTLELKKIIELIKQNTYEKKNKKNTIPEALISTKEKHIIKEHRSKEWRDSEQDRKIKASETEHADFVMLKTGHQCINARTRSQLQQMRKERTLRKSTQTEIQQQPNGEKTNRRRMNRTN